MTKPIRKKKKNPRPIRRGNKNRGSKKGAMKIDEAELLQLQALVLPHLEKAAEVGSWVVAVFRPNGNRVEVDWLTQDFPTEDFPVCVKLLDDELKAERKKLEDGKKPVPF